MSDRITSYKCKRRYLLAAYDKHVQRVSVVGIGTRYKTVVCRIVRRGIKYPVQYQHTRLLVDFILILAPLRAWDRLSSHDMYPEKINNR